MNDITRLPSPTKGRGTSKGTLHVVNPITIKIAEQLKNTSLFKGMSVADLQALVQAMKPQYFALGDILFKRGDPGDAMYIIVSGSVRIYTRDTQGNEFTLTHYGESKVFGDFSLLDQQPRSAYAAALERTEVLVLTRDEFMAFLPQHPSVGLAMIRHLTDRLRYITVYLSKVTAFGQRLAQGEYEQAIQEIAGSNADDSEIDGLIATFTEIAQKVKERAERLATP
jgi:CRP-like cAMP-binding protein